MKGPWVVPFVVAALAFPLLANAAEQPEYRGRSYERIELDSATTPGLWGEVATSSATEDSGNVDVSVITVEPRILYGWENWELGLFIPYERIDGDVNFGFFSGHDTEDGIGDIRLSGKGVLRSQWVDGGLGLEMTFPSGDEDKGLGLGKVGFLPFGTGAVHLGPVDLRAHVGYLALVDESDGLIVYGGGPFAAIGDYVALRGEFLGASSTGSGSLDSVTFQPGIDFRIPLGAVNLLIRPTGLVGITDAAPDWGIGGGIAVNWNPEVF